MNKLAGIIKSPLTWIATTLLFGATGLGALAVFSIAMVIISLIVKFAN